MGELAETNRLLNGRGSQKPTESSNLSPSEVNKEKAPRGAFSLEARSALAVARQGTLPVRGILTSCRAMRAVVAQLDRATGYELVGWGFESLRPHMQLKKRLALRTQKREHAIRDLTTVSSRKKRLRFGFAPRSRPSSDDTAAEFRHRVAQDVPQVRRHRRVSEDVKAKQRAGVVAYDDCNDAYDDLLRNRMIRERL